MTKEEQNRIIKDSLIRNLQKETEIPTDIGIIYKNWLVSKIQQASAQLQQPAQQDQAQAPAEQAPAEQAPEA